MTEEWLSSRTEELHLESCQRWNLMKTQEAQVVDDDDDDEKNWKTKKKKTVKKS